MHVRNSLLLTVFEVIKQVLPRPGKSISPQEESVWEDVQADCSESLSALVWDPSNRIKFVGSEYICVFVTIAVSVFGVSSCKSGS